MKHVHNDIIGKPYAPPLKYQYIRAAAWTIEAFGKSLFYKHACPYGNWVVIPIFTVTLYDIADHHGNDFNHSDNPCPCAAVNIRINYGYKPSVFWFIRLKRTWFHEWP